MFGWLFKESEFDKAYNSLDEDVEQWDTIKHEVFDRLLELGELSNNCTDLYKANALKFKVERRLVGEGRL